MGRASFLNFSPPFIDEEEVEAVVRALRSGWITTGPRTREFEEAFRQYIGAPGALALNSCTAGLHVALSTLGIGAGDEVITTPMTFVSTVNVIEHVGAKPVLADVEPDTLNIDPRQVVFKITKRTRAIIAVHYAGHAAELGALRQICDDHGLHLIEDAAHSLPATYDGAFIGSRANLTAFSFYATKNLTTGEGGMLTGDPELLARARVFALHGLSRDAWQRYDEKGSWYYEVDVPGFKYNMTDIQAAMGLVQLRKLDAMHKRRCAVARLYQDGLADVAELELPTQRDNCSHAWHLFVIRLRLEMLGIDRAEFIENLKTRNIGSSVHFIPVHTHPYYRDKYDFKGSDFPVAMHAYERVVSLPIHPGLSDDDVADVIHAVQDVVRSHRR